MNKRILSIMLIILMCFALFPLSAAAAVNVTAAYADGVVIIAGTGFIDGVSYTVRVVDTANSSVKAMGQATADGSGNISASVTTGALSTLADYAVYVNNPDGTLAGADISIDGEETGLTDAQKMAADKAALTDNLIKGENSSLNNVTVNLNLITSIPGGAGCTISWVSGNKSVIGDDGTVTRPAGGDVSVTLLATITSGSASDTRQFTATVKQQPVMLYTAAIQAGAGGTITSDTSGSYAAGTVITLAATVNSGYAFSGWTSSGGTFANAGNASTTFTMPATNVTITANFTYRGTGTTTPAPVPTPKPTPAAPSNAQDGNTTTVSTVVNATADPETGVDTVRLDADVIGAMADMAKEAKASGQKPVVEIKVVSTEDARAVEVEIPGSAFQQIAETTDADVKVDTGIGTITFDSKAVTSINASAQERDISISIRRVEKNDLSGEIQAMVGDRPVYDFSVKAEDTEISDFGGGKAEISILYMPKEGEKENAIIVYYIDNTGELKTIQGRYDPETGTVKFVTGHFSKYAVGYNEVNFSDVKEDDWYGEAVRFMAARSIIQGIGGGRFAPEANVKRADFLIMVMNSYGIALDTDITGNFSDAGSKYYTGYLGTAKRLELVSGIGNNKYAPDAEISRQDMFVILYRALDVLGELPTGTSGRDIASFRDAGDIADYAEEAMKLLVETGTIEGDGVNLTPKATSTRAEAAQVLYNLLTK